MWLPLWVAGVLCLLFFFVCSVAVFALIGWWRTAGELALERFPRGARFDVRPSR